MNARILPFVFLLCLNAFGQSNIIESNQNSILPENQKTKLRFSLSANYQSNFYREDQVGSGQAAYFAMGLKHALNRKLAMSYSLGYSKRLEDYREGDFDNFSISLQGLKKQWDEQWESSILPVIAVTLNEEERNIYYSQGSAKLSVQTIYAPKKLDILQLYLNLGGRKNAQEFKTDFNGESLTSYQIYGGVGAQVAITDKLSIDGGYSLFQSFTYQNRRKDPSGSFSILAVYIFNKHIAINGGLTSLERLYNDSGNTRDWERYIVSSDTVLTLGMNYVF